MVLKSSESRAERSKNSEGTVIELNDHKKGLYYGIMAWGFAQYKKVSSQQHFRTSG